MKRFSVTSKLLFQITVTLLGIPAALLLLLALTATSLLFFFALGGGWAYAGPAGCHFKLNPFGMIMLAAAALGLIAFLFAMARRYHTR